MITFLFKEFPSFFKRLIPSGIFHSNYHLLSLDGHGFHAMINNITCATNWVGHDHIVISHVPCPTNPYMLIVSSLQNNSQEENAMVINNMCAPKKCTFTTWVKKALDYFLSQKTIKNGFRAIKIWPFNPQAMDDKTKPNEVYAILIVMYI